MHLRQLRYFIKVVEAGSISRAASLVFIAQPALSSQMTELEAELGVTLLRRNARGVSATPAGEALYREACRIVKDFDRIPDVVRASEQEIVGAVNFGMSSVLALAFAGSTIKACKESLPHVGLRLSIEDSPALREKLLQEAIDLAVLLEEEPMPGLTRTPLFRQEVFLLHTDEAHRHTASLSLAEVAAFPLILPAMTHGWRLLINKRMSALGLKLNVVAETHDIASDLAAVAAGVGATILAIADLAMVPGADAVIATRIDGVALTASLSWSRDVTLSRAAEAVRAFIVPFFVDYIQTKHPIGIKVIES